jgi:hypothetical protein
MSKRTRFNHVSVKGDNIAVEAHGYVHYVPKEILDYRLEVSYHHHNPEIILYHVVLNYADGKVYYVKCVDNEELEDVAAELDALGLVGHSV